MNVRARLAGFGRGRLRLLLGLFFLALAAPTAVLVRQAHIQLKWESFHQHRVLAEELAARIDARLARLVEAEEARSFSDYAFLVVAGDPKASFVQRSPLSDYPVKSAIPGLMGWFQLDAQGIFSTPLLPPRAAEASAYGIPGPESEQRSALQARLWEILSRNRLVQARKDDSARETPAPGPRLKDLEESLPLSATSTEKDAAKPARRGIAAPAPPAAPAPAQAAFDELGKTTPERKKKQEAAGTLGSVEDLGLGSRYQAESAGEDRSADPGKPALMEKRAGRKERSVLPEPRAPAAAGNAAAPAPAPLRVATFESDIDPFEFARLDSGHFVLFRKVWRDGQRYIQGLLIESAPFLRDQIETEFRATALSRMSKLAVAHRGEVLAAFSGAAEREYLRSAREMRGDLLYRTRLSAPLGDLELIFTLDRLPAGPGGAVVGWLAGILAVVLCGGFYLMYRLGLRQIDLARQQQDFISAVSHELKTPLTSIRMYGEMLRAGWVSEDRKPAYYDFIYSESERLSRLIANVLQLARLTRNGLDLDLKPVAAPELMDNVRSKVGSQAERAGFALRFAMEPDAAEAVVRVDADAFAQIAINLVDNALKFSAKSPRKAIDIGFHLQRDRTLAFSVRDYGPGVPRDQRRKIFRLFYRLENELTRETVGTGIGLALVHRLALAMEARVDVANREPGAEFRVVFRTVTIER
jgi:two-component system phosphate regulon sensor histidine kinase PhoR